MKISDFSWHSRAFKVPTRKAPADQGRQRTTRVSRTRRAPVQIRSIRRFSLSLVLGFCAFLCGENSWARPFRPDMIPNGSVFSCLTCHVTPAGGSPRNKFGLDVFAIVRGSTATPFWSPTLAGKDSDGDGSTNGDELGDPDGDGIPIEGAEVTNPGDPNSKPAVNLPPAIQVIAPTNSSVFPTTALVTVEVAATDSDGSVIKVEFFVGTNLVFVATSAPFTYTLKASTVPAGTSSILAQATDDKGGITRSDPIQITIGELQPVVITSISKSGDAFNIAWTGGIGPFRPQLKTAVSDAAWVDGQLAASRETVIPANGTSAFIRIVDLANNP